MSLIRSPRLRLTLSLLLLLALLVVVEYWLGWERVVAPWLQMNPLQGLFAVAIVQFSYGVRTQRLVSYFREDLKGRFPQALRLMLLHNLWNNLLPMRTGELSFPLLMKSYFSIDATRSVPALFWFRLLDLYVVLMLALGSLLIMRDDDWIALPLMLVLTLAVPLSYRLLPWLLRILESKVPDRAGDKLAQIRQALPGNWRQMLLSCFWTLVNWGVKLAAFAWIVMQFAPVEASAALLGAIGGELTSVLPINGVAGAGSYEAGVVAALLPAAIDQSTALIAAVNLHLFLLSCTLLSGLFSLLIPAQKKLEITGSIDDQPRG